MELKRAFVVAAIVLGHGGAYIRANEQLKAAYLGRWQADEQFRHLPIL